MTRFLPHVLLFFAGIYAAEAPSRAKDGIFRLRELPSGASVTLPRPATTYLAPGDEARLTATDAPQSVKLSSIHQRGRKAATLNLEIIDLGANKTKQVVIRPKQPFIYNFPALQSIKVKAAPLSGANNKFQMVLIESDKPLEISR